MHCACMSIVPSSFSCSTVTTTCTVNPGIYSHQGRLEVFVKLRWVVWIGGREFQVLLFRTNMLYTRAFTEQQSAISSNHRPPPPAQSVFTVSSLLLRRFSAFSSRDLSVLCFSLFHSFFQFPFLRSDLRGPLTPTIYSTIVIA